MTERKPKVKLTNKDIKKIADKVAREHANQPKPQMLVRRVVKNNANNYFGAAIGSRITGIISESVLGKKISLGKKLFVGWGFEGNSIRLVRKVREIEFIVDFTNTKKESLKNLQFDDIISRVIKCAEIDGWYPTDRLAYKMNLDIIADNLSRLANQIHRDEICRHAAGDMVLSCSNFIKDGDSVLYSLRRLNAKLKTPLAILPDLTKFEVKNGELVEKKCVKTEKSTCKKECKKNKVAKKPTTKKGK